MQEVRIYDGRDGRTFINQPSWMFTLQVGDVITNGGRYRIVRDLMRRRDGRLHCVALAIKRCSWTHRCYTILNATELRIFGYRRVPAKRRALKKKGDRLILAAMRQPSWEPKILGCCDVEGVP